MEWSTNDLPLQILFADGKLLVVCTSACGEAYLFIDKPDTERLIAESLSLHRRIDRLIGDGLRSPTAGQARKLAKAMRQLGEQLFACVFRGRLLDLLNIVIGNASRLRRTATIRLLIATEWLNLIPWELLSHRDSYLCHVYDLARHPFMAQPTHHPVRPHAGPLRLLFIAANPRKNLLIDAQLEAFQKAAAALGIEPICLVTPNATYTKIADAIFQGADVLHVLAHGVYNTTRSHAESYLEIDAEEALPYAKLPIEMLQSLCLANPMRLAILDACRSDQAVAYTTTYGSSSNLMVMRYNSMAYSLVRVGLPGVVGLSHPISKAGGSILARRLYQVLISKGGTIDEAIRLARIELYSRGHDLLPSDWIAPVLYSRSESE